MAERIKNQLAGTTTISLCPIGKTLLAVAIVLVIALIYSYVRVLGDIDSALYGLWEVDSSFAERAEVDAMYLFIAPPADSDRGGSKGGRAVAPLSKKPATVTGIGPFGQATTGYMLIKTGGIAAFNSPIKLRLRRTSLRADSIHKYALDLGQPVACIPRHVTLEYDPCTAMMTLTSGKTMYARLFKKPEASYYTALGGKELDDGDAPDNSRAADELAAEPAVEQNAGPDLAIEPSGGVADG